MASSANSDTANRDAALRRVAIVLSSLPAAVAAKLLGSVDQDAKQTIRQTMASLADVDPLERRRALQAFKVSVQQTPIETSSGDTFSRSSSSRYSDHSINSRAATSSVGRSSVAPYRPGQASSETPYPLAFLGEVEDDQLVGLLSDEHAQAVALVLASVAPTQAARILPRLDAALRSSALSRLSRLGDIPETAIVEVAQHFRMRLSQHDVTSTSTRTGKRALDAILAAMPTPDASTMSHTSQVATPSTQSRPPDRHRSTEINPDRASTVDSAHRLRIAPQTTTADVARDMHSSDASNATHQKTLQFASTDAIHSHLNAMSAKELCVALGRVSTRDAMLTLCGLPNAKAEAVLSILPRDQARVVRGQMISLSSLNLREIDEAKERVAMASASGDAKSDRPIAQRYAAA